METLDKKISMTDEELVRDSSVFVAYHIPPFSFQTWPLKLKE